MLTAVQAQASVPKAQMVAPPPSAQVAPPPSAQVDPRTVTPSEAEAETETAADQGEQLTMATVTNTTTTEKEEPVLFISRQPLTPRRINKLCSAAQKSTNLMMRAEGAHETIKR